MPTLSRAWVYPALVLFALLLGCAKPGALPDYSSLRTEVEKLYLNYQELKVVHSNLHAAACQHLEQGGEQLAHIQSAARFIDQANLVAFYQWELLSITSYIRDSARADFFTLRVADIDDARQKSEDLILAIKVYDAFIRDPAVLSLIDRGVGHIQQSITLYDALQALMMPLSNAPRPQGRQESL